MRRNAALGSRPGTANRRPPLTSQPGRRPPIEKPEPNDHFAIGEALLRTLYQARTFEDANAIINQVLARSGPSRKGALACYSALVVALARLREHDGRDDLPLVRSYKAFRDGEARKN
jgi:hypothetical protein